MSSGRRRIKATRKTIEGDVEEDILSLQKLQVVAWIYLLVLSLGGGIIVSWTFALSIFAGGVISILSFIVSFKDIVGYFGSLSPAQSEEEEKEQVKSFKVGYLLKFWLRIGVIGVILLLLIKSGKINIFGLILGLTTVVFTVTFMAFSVAKRYFFSGRR